MTSLYLTHGGGPLPLLGDAGHTHLVAFLKSIPERIPPPEAILLISAHWEQPNPVITGGEQPGLIYDYGGFPSESYQIKYPAPGSPRLAEEVQGLLAVEGFNARQDANRGFDHGMFVPLILMYPEANIPTVQLSLLDSLDPAQHIKMGQALSPLHKKNILIIGSGSSFHNMRILVTGSSSGQEESSVFNDWLVQTCTGSELAEEERFNRLVHWQQAPHARFCHPREEHLLPLHVCMGSKLGHAAEQVFDNKIMGITMSGFFWE